MQDSVNNNTRGGKGLTFSSWNVRGLNNPVKRGKILTDLKSLASDIMFLQETHLNNSSHGRLRAKWIGEICHSNFSSKARGAAFRKRRTLYRKKQLLTEKVVTL